MASLTIFGLLTSCNNEALDSEPVLEPISKKNLDGSSNKTISINTKSAYTEKGEQLILGKQLKNAYSVQNMKNAVAFYNNLYPKTSEFIGKDIQATHQYIKLTPSTEQDLLILEEIAKADKTIILSKHSLDYLVIQEGSDYSDPDYNGTPEFAPVYTTVPDGYTINVKHEILSNLYKPKETEYDIETIALAMAGWNEDLKSDFNADVTINNVSQFLDGPNPETLTYRRFFNPIGIIAMQIYDNGTLEGLKFAKLKIGRYFWWDYTFTNEYGAYVSPANYRGTVKVKSAWRNFTATLRMSSGEMLGIDVSDYLFKMDANNYLFTYILYNYGADSKIWYKGAVHNGLHKYAQYATNNGVAAVYDANIWVCRSGTGAASTPMFNKIRNIPFVSAFNNWLQPIMWGSFVNTFLAYGSYLTLPLGHLQPDQLYTGLGSYKFLGQNTFTSNRRIEQTVFHESGHFVHAMRAGTNNYSKIVAAELKNSTSSSSGSPYLNGQQPTVALGKQIALAEGWATYIENKCMQHYYGYSIDKFASPQSLPTYIENYTMIQTPSTATLLDNKSWFLTGLLWDLTDKVQEVNSTYVLGNGLTFINDILDGAAIPETPLSIYFHLNSDVYNAQDLKTKLQLATPTQAGNIHDLYKYYGL